MKLFLIMLITSDDDLSLINLHCVIMIMLHDYDYALFGIFLMPYLFQI